MRRGISLGGKRPEFFVSTGDVLEIKEDRETRVWGSYGGGGSIQGGSGGVSVSGSISSDSILHKELWIRNEDTGNEQRFNWHNIDFAVREQHKVTVVQVYDKKKKYVRICALINHTLGRYSLVVRKHEMPIWIGAKGFVMGLRPFALALLGAAGVLWYDASRDYIGDTVSWRLFSYLNSLSNDPLSENVFYGYWRYFFGEDYLWGLAAVGCLLTGLLILVAISPIIRSIRLSRYDRQFKRFLHRECKDLLSA